MGVLIAELGVNVTKSVLLLSNLIRQRERSGSNNTLVSLIPLFEKCLGSDYLTKHKNESS